jgi:hypothetical protein
MKLQQDQDLGRTMESDVQSNVNLIFAGEAFAYERTSRRDPSNYSPCSLFRVPASYEHFYLWEVLRNPVTNVSSLIQRPTIRLCGTLRVLCL